MRILKAFISTILILGTSMATDYDHVHNCHNKWIKFTKHIHIKRGVPNVVD